MQLRFSYHVAEAVEVANNFLQQDLFNSSQSQHEMIAQTAQLCKIDRLCASFLMQSLIVLLLLTCLVVFAS